MCDKLADLHADAQAKNNTTALMCRAADASAPSQCATPPVRYGKPRAQGERNNLIRAIFIANPAFLSDEENQAKRRDRAAILIATSAASAPLLPSAPPARSRACCSSSVVSTPNTTGASPRALSIATPCVTLWHT